MEMPHIHAVEAAALIIDFVVGCWIIYQFRYRGHD